MEPERKYTLGIVLCIVLALTYLLFISNVEQSQGNQFFQPAFKKAPSLAQSLALSHPPEPSWEEPGPYYVAYPRNYRFILEDTVVCKESSPFVLLVVPVAPTDVKARNIIRSSWGRRVEIRGRLVQTLFFLGVRRGVGSEQLQEKLRQENQQHHDLVQSSFIDSYRNLTVKTMVTLEWLAANCSSSVAYVVKVDSDIFLHVRNLMDLLLQPDTPKTNYMTGLVWWHSPVLRSPGNKFYLPPEVFAEPEYPPYPLGMIYIMSLDLPQKILGISREIKPIFIEDAYLGMCLKRLQILPTDPPRQDMFLVNAQHPLSPCALSRVVATTTTSMPMMMTYWRRSQLPQTHC
ncbi:beta-1,3-galactosyltransferase 2-like [Boleophthalmus pectinirostris]|uniref:beta-1,3-galactosyltransferase 2-like n=1 Tax=Boleophthalmus pectinirostris TaxID=150288 RepID=UPI000A1C4FAD|nr:beta-1,3-galactosyltransferase 2-like [Boleophthalmus pectinirostris]